MSARKPRNSENKLTRKKLRLSKETLKDLSGGDLKKVQGGVGPKCLASQTYAGC